MIMLLCSKDMSEFQIILAHWKNEIKLFSQT